MGNGMNKVLPGLYVGNFRDAKDMEQLKANNITHIISLHDNAKPIIEGMTYKCLEVFDCPEQNLSKHFHECIDFIHKCRMENGAVLVHCIAGVSRSTTVVAAYIMAVTTLNWREAILAVRHQRAIANPNHGFQRQLLEFGNREIPKIKKHLVKKFPATDFTQDQRFIDELLKKAEEKNSTIQADSEDPLDFPIENYLKGARNSSGSNTKASSSSSSNVT